MKLREDQERLQGLLKETLTLLCKNGLQFDKGFCIDALIGITTDDKDVFLVNIRETIKNPDAESSDNEDESVNQKPDGVSSDEENERSRSGRKRPPDNFNPSPVKRSRSDNIDDDDAASNFSSVNDSTVNIKTEPHDDDDELVFVKQELSENESSNRNMAYPIGAYPAGPQGLNQSLQQNYGMNMNSPNTSLDGSQMGHSLNDTWSHPRSSASNLDPAALANVSMASQSTSQGGSQQELTCYLCFRVYKQKNDFSYHMRCVHNVGKPLKCSTCGDQDFRSYSTYRRHRIACTKAHKEVYKVQRRKNKKEPEAEEKPNVLFNEQKVEITSPNSEAKKMIVCTVTDPSIIPSGTIQIAPLAKTTSLLDPDFLDKLLPKEDDNSNVKQEAAEAVE